MAVIISAAFKAKPGKEKEVENVLKAMVPKVQDEKGALQYSFHRGAADLGKFLFYERYVDQDAVNYHLSTPYLKECLSSLEGLLAGDPEIGFYEEVAAIKR